MRQDVSAALHCPTHSIRSFCHCCRVLPPIDAPSIFGVGVNFLDPDGSVPCEDNDLPAAPDGHARMYALIPHGGPIHTCTDGQPVHFWGQLAVIIRRKCVDVSEEEVGARSVLFCVILFCGHI